MQAKPFSPLFLLLLLSLPFTALVQADEKQPPESGLTIAYRFDSKPIQFQDDEGEAAGVLIDFWRLWSQQSGVPVRFVAGSNAETQEMVKEGRADINAGLFESEKRAAFLDFSEPILSSPYYLFYRDGLSGIRSVGDLVGRRVGVTEGSFHEHYLRKQHPKLELALYKGYTALFRGAVRGEVDLLVTQPLYIDRFQREESLAQGFRMMTPPLYVRAYKAGVAKGRGELLQTINRHFSTIDTGARTAITSKWLGLQWVEPASGGVDLGLSEAEQEWLREHPVIDIGVDGNWPPIDFFDDSGNHRGISADYLELIGQRLGVEFRPHKGPQFKQMLQKVMDGELKVGASISFKKERAERLWFTRPFFQVQKVIMSREGGAKPRDITDLYGKLVAVEDGFLTMRQLQERHPQIRLLPKGSTLEALQAVSWGQADAYVGNQVVAAWLARRQQLSNLSIAADAGLGSGPQNFAVSKEASDWEPLVAILDKGLQSIGLQQRSAIEQRWVGAAQGEEPLSPVELTQEERRWLEQHPQIRLGVDAEWAPLEFIDGEGVYKGISSDYMALFAKQLGIDWVQPQGFSWQQVLDGLRSRRIDVAPLVTATEQRLEYLRFTSPYLNLPIVIFDRRGERLLSGLDELRGRRVGVVAGYAITELLERDYPELELLPYPTTLDGLKATALGENDAFVGSLAVGGYLIAKEGLSNIEVAASTPYRSQLAIGVRKDWPELVGILDKLIDSVSEKQRNAIFRHWLTVTYDHQVDYTLLWRVLGSALVLLLLGSVWMLQIRRRNKELDEGRQRLSMALEAAELGTWEAYYAPDGEVVMMVDDQFAWQHRLPLESRRLSLVEFFRYVTPEAARSIQGALESYQQGEVASLTVEYQTHDRGRWIFSQGRALMRGGAGRSPQVIGISQDISGRKEAEAAMEQASRFKSEFLANMSHEIRTPMNAIVGLGHLLSRSDLGPKQYDYVDKIQLSAQSLLGIIDDILDFSKIEAGHLTIESIEFSLEDVLEHLATLTTTRIESKPVEFIYQIDTRVPDRLVGDPYRIGQVLTNLVSNAVKFTERGSIVLKVALDEQESGGRGRTWLRFEVEDTGIGMDQEQIAGLFEPFIQADGSTTRRYGGTGLGLSICKQLTELMGGSIGARSISEQGSLFFFRIPFQLGEPARLPELAVDLRGMRILLVDDNPTVQQVLGEILESLSFRVEVVSSGREALQELRRCEEPYDLVLLDWRMPEMDGVETAERMRSDEQIDNLPIIIMMTAYGREAAEERINRMALDGFLVKPITPSQLFDAIIRAKHDGMEEPESRAERRLQPGWTEVLEGDVLLVEDNPINQEVAREILEQMGLRVQVCGDGREAVERVEAQRPDLVLMDIQMPELDGYQATRLIRRLPGCGGLPIIAMTAHAMVGDANRSEQAGMNGHITKPVDPELLHQTLKRWLPTIQQPPTDSAQSELAAQEASLPPALPGIDVELGVRLVGGNRDLYRQLLVEFLHNHGDSERELSEQLQQGETPAARRLAHTLRGVAGNIGAVELQKAAERIERLIDEGESVSESDLAAFSGACRELFCGLSRLAEDGEEASAGAARELDLEGLRQALERGDAQSAALFKAMRDPLGEQLGEEAVQRMAAWIDDYEFELAAELLARMLSE